jgi:uncharacterized protein with beta-barrel porin domain
VRWELRAAWQHNYGEVANPVDFQLASDAGGLFTTDATTIGRNSARVSAVAVQNGNERISGGLRVSL